MTRVGNKSRKLSSVGEIIAERNHMAQAAAALRAIVARPISSQRGGCEPTLPQWPHPLKPLRDDGWIRARTFYVWIARRRFAQRLRRLLPCHSSA